MHDNVDSYSYTKSLHLCSNYIQSSYVVHNLTISGQGHVNIDCENQWFFYSGIPGANTGRIVNLKLGNINLSGGPVVGKVFKRYYLT
jgi:hypothetical protein